MCSSSSHPALSEHHGGDVMHQRRVWNGCHLGRWRRRLPALRLCAGRSVSGALLVRAQARQLRVRALADVTLVGSLAGVEAHVVAQGRGLAEATVAETADERFVQGVNAHVRAQVTARVEAAVTDDAAHA